MTIDNGMTLYHGSYTIVEKPDLDLCHEGKDFGRGFYLTTDLDQAKRFTKMSIRKAMRYGQIERSHQEGYVSVFRLKANDGIAINLLEPDNLRDQLCFRTIAAIEKLEYEGYEVVYYE